MGEGNRFGRLKFLSRNRHDQHHQHDVPALSEKVFFHNS